MAFILDHYRAVLRYKAGELGLIHYEFVDGHMNLLTDTYYTVRVQ